jgi:hypothetical protein
VVACVVPAEVVAEGVISVVAEREVPPAACVVIMLGRVSPISLQEAEKTQTVASIVHARHREMIFFMVLLLIFANV